MHDDLEYDPSLRDPPANRRFYLVVLLVVGVLAAATGLFQRARWSLDGCTVLAGTDAACLRGPGTGLLIAGVAMIAISVAGLVLRWRRRG